MVSSQKKEQVQQLAQDIQRSQVVGLVNMQNLPAPQLQRMRVTLAKQGVRITMSRKKLLRRSLEGSKKENIQQLMDKIKGMPAIILTDSNPFMLYSTIQKNKSEAPAKAGQISPRDIVVKAGPTTFAPGPIISELAAVGIKTKVEGGKLSIMQDTTIVKEGQAISSKVAETLKRLDIKPMEIGLDLVAVWEKGLVFDAKQLHIDEAEYSQNITQAAQWAMSLALEAAYTSAETIELLLQKAFNESKALSLDQNIMTDVTAGDILAKAEREALALSQAGQFEVQVEPKPREEAIARQPVHPPEEKIVPQHHDTPHPKQGHVTPQEAADLLEVLQKKGTLR